MNNNNNSNEQIIYNVYIDTAVDNVVKLYAFPPDMLHVKLNQIVLVCATSANVPLVCKFIGLPLIREIDDERIEFALTSNGSNVYTITGTDILLGDICNTRQLEFMVNFYSFAGVAHNVQAFIKFVFTL